MQNVLPHNTPLISKDMHAVLHISSCRKTFSLAQLRTGGISEEGEGDTHNRKWSERGDRWRTKGQEKRDWKTLRSFLSTHPFIDFSVLQLYKASTDSSNVALLIREGDPPCSLGVLQLGVGVDASVANAPIQTVHDHGQLHCRGREE